MCCVQCNAKLITCYYYYYYYTIDRLKNTCKLTIYTTRNIGFCLHVSQVLLVPVRGSYMFVCNIKIYYTTLLYTYNIIYKYIIAVFTGTLRLRASVPNTKDFLYYFSKKSLTIYIFFPCTYYLNTHTYSQTHTLHTHTYIYIKYEQNKRSTSIGNKRRNSNNFDISKTCDLPQIFYDLHCTHIIGILFIYILYRHIYQHYVHRIYSSIINIIFTSRT